MSVVRIQASPDRRMRLTPERATPRPRQRPSKKSRRDVAPTRHIALRLRLCYNTIVKSRKGSTIDREAAMKVGLASSPKPHFASQVLFRDQGGVEIPMLCSEHREYRVYLQAGVFSNSGYPLKELLKGRRNLLVATPSVDALFGASLRSYFSDHGISMVYTVVTCTEATKTVDTVAHICRIAQDAELDRKSFLVSFGGGACCDIVSFSASMIRRGIGHVRVPTTLIGQVDAGIAVKGAVNFGSTKNYLGCFFPPSAVVIDPEFLRTLQASAIRNGLSEIVKMAILRDAELFNLVDRHVETLLESRFTRPVAVRSEIIERSIALMLDELRQNPYENKGYERYVDFGHTFSPQLEASSGFTLPHGEAVAIDMALSSVIANKLGVLALADLNRILRILTKIGLPIYSPLLTRDLCEHALDGANLHRGGCANLVVPVAIARATFVRNKSELPPHLLAEAIDELRRSR
jgi:2-epi-5-epi-valiolone synthase